VSKGPWDSVVIGRGDKGCSATLALSLPNGGSISRNGVSFWISDVYLGLGMTIFMGTTEGDRLVQMLSAKKEPSIVAEWLEGLLLSNIERGELKEAVANAINQAFERGNDAKAAEIREVLGINH
jgi:hypothetical protein